MEQADFQYRKALALQSVRQNTSFGGRNIHEKNLQVSITANIVRSVERCNSADELWQYLHNQIKYHWPRYQFTPEGVQWDEIEKLSRDPYGHVSNLGFTAEILKNIYSYFWK